MKSSFDILSVLYRYLNVTAITNVITGEIYKGSISAKSQKQDIEIAVLTNQNKYVQRGFVNVNFYCKEIKENTPDNKKFTEIATLLTPILDEVQIENINFQIDSQTGPHKDREVGRDGMYYLNFKINFQTL